ncbi:hypothetical protein ILUMI_09081 [Ignelater luminosus]|uniref:CLIP domain-containing serine protease n=1 Tax=Ignelater luminosus TaxID=2038154 RepID=A0A8K0DA04_IGNLU|nr:hypothetical protein ILUMI_09081 [Ignelater luminosus]
MRMDKLISMNLLHGLLVAYLGAIVTIKAQWVIDDDGCRTPDNGVGRCLLLRECDPIVKYIDSAVSPTSVAKETLKSYVCGVTGGAIKVCCPYSNKIVVATPSTLAPDPAVTPELENHQKALKCTTPSASAGTCVPVKECQPIIDFIRNSSPLSPPDVQILRSYQCIVDNSARVCCPDSNFVIPSSKNPNNESPPDVTNHRNIGLLPMECGPVLSDRIVFGNKTLLFEYPWMALLNYKLAKSGSTDFRCGATVINDWYILTAAHCVVSRATLQLVSVRVGEHTINTDPDCEEVSGNRYCADPVQDIDIAEVIPHPRYDSKTLENDIGLIRLASRINSAVDSVKPICLPTTEDLRNKNFENAKLTVTGWGITETDRKSLDLLQVNVPVVSEEQCRKAYEKTEAIVTRRQICAGGINGGDSCNGDSGGPLKVIAYHNNDARFVQYGVVSFGPRFCGQDGFPGVYTRVDYYMDWILDNMKP